MSNVPSPPEASFAFVNVVAASSYLTELQLREPEVREHREHLARRQLSRGSRHPESAEPSAVTTPA